LFIAEEEEAEAMKDAPKPVASKSAAKRLLVSRAGLNLNN